MIVDKRLLKNYYERQGEESNPHVYESMSLRNILFVNRRRIIRNLLAAQGVSLDLGCGTGIYSVDLVRKGCEVVSLDISRSYLLKARKLSVTLGVEHMQNFIEADAEYLPFRSNAFDFVLCSETLEHVADYKRTLFEIFRILRRSGTLVISIPSGISVTELLLYGWEHIHRINPRWLKKFLLMNKFAVLKEVNFNFGAYILHIIFRDSRSDSATTKFTLLKMYLIFDSLISRIWILKSISWGYAVKAIKR